MRLVEPAPHVPPMPSQSGFLGDSGVVPGFSLGQPGLAGAPGIKRRQVRADRAGRRRRDRPVPDLQPVRDRDPQRDDLRAATRRRLERRARQDQQDLQPGAVMLRDGKRPRPIVLRVNEGDCLEIHFTNLLAKHKPRARRQSVVPDDSRRERACPGPRGRGYRATMARGWKERTAGEPGPAGRDRSLTGSSRARRGSTISSARAWTSAIRQPDEQRPLRHGHRRAEGSTWYRSQVTARSWPMPRLGASGARTATRSSTTTRSTPRGRRSSRCSSRSRPSARGRCRRSSSAIPT